MYIFASLFHPFTQTAGLRLSPGFGRGSFGARVLLRRPELSPSRLNSQLGPWFFGTRVRWDFALDSGLGSFAAPVLLGSLELGPLGLDAGLDFQLGTPVGFAFEGWIL